MRSKNTLTEGAVFPVLVQFSLPYLFTNILQALYSASDLFMVGRFSDSVGVSAVATGGQIMQTITSLIIGLTAGGTIITAKHFGAKKRSETANTAATAAYIFSILSIFMTFIVVMFLNQICTLMQVPIESLKSTKSYLFICSLGIGFIVGFNTIGGILRGMGDSRTPFFFMTIACFTNIAADFLLVGIFQLGATGAAIATVFAQGICLMLSVYYLHIKGYFTRFKKFKPSFQLIEMQSILGVGTPIALQEGLVNLSFLMITAIINRMGLAASAAVGIVEKLIVFSMLPTTAFAAAVSSMTAQNIGAGKLDRAKSCLNGGIFLSLLFGISCYLLCQFIPYQLVSLFTKDQVVQKIGVLYLRSYSIDCLIVCFIFCMNTFFSSSGHPIFPLVHSLISTFLLRVPLSYYLSCIPNISMSIIGFAAPLASIISLLLCFHFYNKWYYSKADSCCKTRDIKCRFRNL